MRTLRTRTPEPQPLPPRVLAEFSAKALQGNFRAIQEQVPDHALLPMVKANAYGHGMEWTAKTLLAMPNLYAFGVASLQEGAELRQALGLRARRTKIVVFSGAAPWSEEKGQFCEENGLTPVIASDADWHEFLRRGWTQRLPYHLKFNTGMNRLGISPGLAKSIARALANRPSEEHPAGVCSHLAVGEDPKMSLSQQQAELFVAVRADLASALPSTLFHLANSSGIWNSKHFGLKGLTDIVRPGLSLYGVPPWPEAPARGIEPVMTLKIGVIAVHQLKAGESIGYGATYKVVGKDPVRAAILSGGYADGIKRGLSNRGYAWLGGEAKRFLGIVSMDMSAIEAGPGVKPGDMAEVLGPHVDAWAQARAAGTIPYELLTSLSARVERNYG